ncbi:MAG TPA: TonB-dependent receptor [Candidatus Baltobacteraceae bacterium]|jgi:hypothetical protein
MNVSLIHRTAGAFLALALVLSPVSSVVAGTTGSITGTVVDATAHAPIAGAAVTVVSPSQIATVTTDASGRFTFISLAPDTYTVSARKAGYDEQSVAGISVFADQSQSVPVALQKSLKQIAHVTSRSSLSPVRPGTGTDVYSVNPAVATASATLGGGGGMNTAYSAIAAMPGAYVPPNQVGVNQTVYIRGGYYDQIGFEYDGVPVNRSFDNYPSSGLTTLGQQELQIYTGGGEADANATGLGGFINQVIKTGTFPGYAVGGLAMGTPTFYHDARVEVGGATPDRLFSYYVGVSGTNQAFRYFDQYNGASLSDTVPYGTYPSDETTNLAFFPAVYPTCNANTTYTNPAANGAHAFLYKDPGCFGYFPANYGQPSDVDDRQVVANMHFGVPHKNDSGRDDIQLLYMSSATFTQYYSSVNDAGPLGLGIVNSGTLNYHDFYAGLTNQWGDFYTFPGGTKWLAPASTPPIAYLYPGSPTGRCANVVGVPGACPEDARGNQETVQIPNDYRDGRWDTAGIVKLQYQKNMGSNAYLRLFGYTFYSNTNRATANGWGNAYAFGVTNYQYEVDSHTRGLELQFADQISSSNLVSGMLSYLDSGTLRYYSHQYDNTGSAQVSNFTDGNICYSTKDTKHYPIGHPAPCNKAISQGFFSAPYGYNVDTQDPCAAGEVPANSPACRNGAAMNLTYLGNNADYNSVMPKVSSGSIQDQWRPTDRWNLNAALRYENDTFDLANTDNPGTNFWFNAAQREFCVNPVTRQPIFVPQPPQYIYYYQPLVTFHCPIDRSTGTAIQTVHPNGTDGILLTNNYPSQYSQTYFLPRLSLTYAASPDTVFRASAGRYAQAPQNYEIQYATAQPNLASTLLGFIPFGFNSPLHPSQAQFSNNYDVSWEQHLRGTDIAFKVTPYFRWGTNQLYESVDLPSLGVSPSFNAGTLRVDGVEFELTKGDFDKNGLSGIFSYTYTNSSEKWGDYPNSTIGPVDQYIQDIQEFNALTKKGGGAPCYTPDRTGTAAPGCPSTSIRNPYYAMAPQPLLDPHAWYTTGLDYPYLSPNTFSLVLNYRHGKFAFTPAMSLQEGTTYGNPSDVQGMDPRSCYSNQRTSGVPSSTPLNADYTSCSHALTSDGTTPGKLYIPNPQTGTFDQFGQFQQPWQFNLGAQLSYDVSPRITTKFIVTNILNTCFGGSSTPWTKAYPPGGFTCAYTYNKFYNNGNNFNEGTSAYDLRANGVAENPYFANSFVPSYGDPFSGNYPLALNMYFSVNVKL